MLKSWPWISVCTETPQVVSRDDFDAYVQESGMPVIYRGVKDIEGMTGENMQFQMMYDTQKPYYGDGIFGDGLYFSDRQSTAESYAGRAEISKCTVRSDAKFIDFDSDDMREAQRRIAAQTRL